MSVTAAYDVLDYVTSLPAFAQATRFASSEPFPLPTGDNMRTTNLKRMPHIPISSSLNSILVDVELHVYMLIANMCLLPMFSLHACFCMTAISREGSLPKPNVRRHPTSSSICIPRGLVAFEGA
jgi:hypothetical protein